MYRYTKDGRRVCRLRAFPGGPSATWLVTDADAPRVTRRARRVVQVSLLVMVLGMFLADKVWHWDPFLDTGSFLRWLPLLIVLAITSGVATRLWAFRGLPRVQLAESELVPVDGREQRLNHAREMGMPMLAFLTAASFVMTAGQVWVLVEDHPWWSWMATPLFVAMTAGTAWQSWLLWRDKAHTGGPDMAEPPVA